MSSEFPNFLHFKKNLELFLDEPAMVLRYIEMWPWKRDHWKMPSDMGQNFMVRDVMQTTP